MLFRSRDKTDSRKRSPGLSRLFSFALFATGVVLIVLDTVQRQAEDPAALIATVVFLTPLVAAWPSRKIALSWIPLVLMCVFLAVVHSITPQPLGVWASIGVVLALLGAAHALIADAAFAAKPPDLVAAERWLRSQKRRKEWQPYVEALGIEKASKEAVEDEDWGYKLWTFTEKKKSARPQ